MNWNRIVNIFIAIFLMINIAIFSFSTYKNVQRYTLPADRATQLRSILFKNGYTLYTYVPQYFPMKKIVLEAPQLDEEKITEVIFAGEDVTRTFGTYGTRYERYRSDQQELTFYKGVDFGKIDYTGTNSNYIPESFTKEAVEKVGKAFAEDITLSIPKLKLTISTKFNDYYLLEFNEVYKGEILFCSYVSLKVTAKGVEEASTLRYAPVEFKGKEAKLYPVDEVLYNFMSKVQPKEGELYSIKSLDLGYDLGRGDLEGNYYAQAVPYYRIKIDSREDYYYINAYTNELKQTP